MRLGRRELRFTPFWRLTRWGWLLFNGDWSALWPHRGCDEWHNPSWWLIIPMVGEVVVFTVVDDRSGPEHLYAQGPDGWEGEDVSGCPICKEIKEELDGA
jgi:hypothetical protein